MKSNKKHIPALHDQTAAITETGMEESDHELVTRYRQGDVGALEKLVERYRRPLFGFILNMVRRPEEADEVFQEVWFRAIKAMDRYRSDRFLSWLFRIASNFIIDRYRSRKPLVSFEFANPQGVTLEDAIPDPGRTAMHEMMAQETGGRIAAAIAHLPPEQRAVFLMRVEGELSFKEIAKIQRVSINTALSRMQYALSKLQTLLQKEKRGEV